MGREAWVPWAAVGMWSASVLCNVYSPPAVLPTAPFLWHTDSLSSMVLRKDCVRYLRTVGTGVLVGGAGSIRVSGSYGFEGTPPDDARCEGHEAGRCEVAV